MYRGARKNIPTRLGVVYVFSYICRLITKKITIIGAGNIARRRVSTLVMFTQNLLVVAPEINKDIELMSKQYKFMISVKEYEIKDILESYIVIAATNNLNLNNIIYRDCKDLGILVNVCSDKTKCDFYFPAIVQKDDVTIGITSGGQNHKLVRETSNKIRNLF